MLKSKVVILSCTKCFFILCICTLNVGKIFSQPAPDPPTLISPLNGSINVPLKPTFIWHNSKNAEYYRFQWSEDSTFKNVSISDGLDTKDTQYTFPEFAGHDKIYWRIVANNNGGRVLTPSVIWSLLTIPYKPYPPNLEIPFDDSDNCSLDQILTWYNDSREVTSHLQVSLQKDFSTLLIDTTGLTETSSITHETSFQLHALDSGKLYYWRVSADNVAGNSGFDIGTPWRFTTVGVTKTPDIVSLVWPPNHSQPSATNDEFSQPSLPFLWQDVASETHFEFQISEDSLFTNLESFELLLADTTIRFPAKENTQYWWRVRAKNGAGYGPFSDAWTFSNVTYTTIGVHNNEVNSNHLLSLYPNPFSNETTLAFSLNKPEEIYLKIYNELGELVWTSEKRMMLDYGLHQMQLSGTTLPEGTLYARMFSGSGEVGAVRFVHSKK